MLNSIPGNGGGGVCLGWKMNFNEYLQKGTLYNGEKGLILKTMKFFLLTFFPHSELASYIELKLFC